MWCLAWSFTMKYLYSYQNISPLQRHSPLWRTYVKWEGKTQGKSIRLKSPINNLRIKNPRWKELSQWTDPKVTDLTMTYAELLHYWPTQGCENSSYKKKCWRHIFPVELKSSTNEHMMMHLFMAHGVDPLVGETVNKSLWYEHCIVL